MLLFFFFHSTCIDLKVQTRIEVSDSIRSDCRHVQFNGNQMPRDIQKWSSFEHVFVCQQWIFGVCTRFDVWVSVFVVHHITDYLFYRSDFSDNKPYMYNNLWYMHIPHTHSLTHRHTHTRKHIISIFNHP